MYFYLSELSEKNQFAMTVPVYSIVDGDFLLPNEIDSWNFQQMLDLGFSETSQSFSYFNQLCFIVYKGVPKEKNSKTMKKIL